MNPKSEERRREAAKHYIRTERRLPFKESMKHAGYKKSYYTANHRHVLEDSRTQEMIKEEHDYWELERPHTKEEAIKLLNDLKGKCETAKDRSNLLGAIKELNRISNLYDGEDGSIKVEQKIVTPAERKAWLLKELKLLEDIEASPLCIAE